MLNDLRSILVSNMIQLGPWEMKSTSNPYKTRNTSTGSGKIGKYSNTDLLTGPQT